MNDPSTRTQIYLTESQRRRLDSWRAPRGVSLAEAVREAVDAFLDRAYVSFGDALDSTWGALPDLAVPSRDEWDISCDLPPTGEACAPAVLREPACRSGDLQTETPRRRKRESNS